MRSEVAPTFRLTGALLFACVATALLGACGGGSSTTANGAPATGPAPQGGATAADCNAAPAQFTNTVWPEMASSCLTCHAAGRVAGGTRLLFDPAGDSQQNYMILRNFVAATGDLVLSKSIGQPSHGGGAPFVDANSQPYKDLAALMPVLQQSCAASTTGTQASGFWSGVQFASDATTIARAAVLFAGRNPTAAESSAAGGGPDALRQTIRGFMQGAAFDRFLDEAGMTQFLTLRVVTRGNGGLVAADFPALANIAQADTARFDAAVQQEPIELMKFIVNGDRPWTDAVQGNYTVVNGVLAQYLGDKLTTVLNHYVRAGEDALRDSVRKLDAM